MDLVKKTKCHGGNMLTIYQKNDFRSAKLQDLETNLTIGDFCACTSHYLSQKCFGSSSGISNLLGPSTDVAFYVTQLFQKLKKIHSMIYLLLTFLFQIIHLCATATLAEEKQVPIMLNSYFWMDKPSVPYLLPFFLWKSSLSISYNLVCSRGG